MTSVARPAAESCEKPRFFAGFGIPKFGSEGKIKHNQRPAGQRIPDEFLSGSETLLQNAPAAPSRPVRRPGAPDRRIARGAVPFLKAPELKRSQLTSCWAANCRTKFLEEFLSGSETVLQNAPAAPSRDVRRATRRRQSATLGALLPFRDRRLGAANTNPRRADAAPFQNRRRQSAIEIAAPVARRTAREGPAGAFCRAVSPF